MATIEERIQALEKEHAAHKQEIAALEQENAARKHTEELLTITVRALVSKEAFEILQATIKESQETHGKLFNVLINQGSLHNERMTDLYTELDGKIVGHQTETRQHFAEMRQRFTEQDGKITELQTTQAVQTGLLQQILARLPEKPQSS